MTATQKELRAACEAGLRRFLVYANSRSAIDFDPAWVAREMYPPKMVVRPRILSHEHYDYRVMAGHLETRADKGPWKNWMWTAEDVRRLADLFANPTETVEEEE